MLAARLHGLRSLVKVVIMLQTWTAGTVIVIEERWHDHLWSAVPHIVVDSSPAQLVTYLPRGTIGTYASNRDLPEADGMTRSERKHAALANLHYRPVERPADPESLHIFRPDRWARVDLGWDGTGGFMGWYVNFERPPEPTPDGVATMDLVLDIYVNPDGSWSWKDREDFDRAIAAGIHPPDLATQLTAEAERIVAELESGTAAFDRRWLGFRPEQPWVTPALPLAFRPDGANWRTEQSAF